MQKSVQVDNQCHFDERRMWKKRLNLVTTPWREQSHGIILPPVLQKSI
jgi:hypothetical protein